MAPLHQHSPDLWQQACDQPPPRAFPSAFLQTAAHVLDSDRESLLGQLPAPLLAKPVLKSWCVAATGAWAAPSLSLSS
jgi:hypothetical protein